MKTSIHFTGTGVPLCSVATQHRIPQMKLFTPETHLCVPASATALATLVWCPRVILTPATVQHSIKSSLILHIAHGGLDSLWLRHQTSHSVVVTSSPSCCIVEYQRRASCSNLCASATKQYKLVSAKSVA